MRDLERRILCEDSPQDGDARFGLGGIVVKAGHPKTRVDEELPQSFAASREYIRVGIVGEESALIEIQRDRQTILRRARSRFLEGIVVDPNAFAEACDTSIEGDQLGLGDSSKIVKRPMQVVRTRIEVLVGPDEIVLISVPSTTPV